MGLTVTRSDSGSFIDGQPATPTEVANLATLEARGQTALANNATYLAIVSPTAAQAVAQTAALTRQVNGVIRLLLAQLDSITDS